MLKSLVGGGIEGIADSMRTNVFTNIAIQARTFETAAGGGIVPVDANGWPTTDFLGRFLTSQPVETINGTYKFSFTGKAKVAPISSPAKVQNYNYDTATNKSTGEIVVNGPTGTASLNIRFLETVGGIQDLKIFRPGYDESKFTTDEFVNLVKPFGTLRFMSVTDTNENLTKTWDERPTPSYARFGFNTTGIPWEYVIKIGNETKKDIWINIPCLANPEYVRSLAEMIYSDLDPALVVYIEWGNEIWNTDMKASKQHSELTKVEIANGDPFKYSGAPGDVTPNNWWYNNIRRQSHKLCEAITIFREVFGKDRNRLRAVLGSQNANQYVTKAQLEYIEKNIGKPSDYVCGVSIAPYLDLSKDMIARVDATPEEIVAEWRVRAKTNVTTVKIAAHKELADKYGLKLMMYEGGPASGQGKINLENKIKAAKHPDMEAITADYYNNWFTLTGGDIANCLDIASRYDQWGTWGLTDNAKETQPKLKGAYTAANQHTWDDVILPWYPPAKKVTKVNLVQVDLAVQQTGDFGVNISVEQPKFNVEYDDGSVEPFPKPSGVF